MSLASETAKRTESFRQLLRPAQLRSLAARDLLAQTSRFARAEPDFIKAHGARYKPLTLTVLASLSAQHLCSTLKLFLYAEGLAPTIHLGGYDSVTSGTLQPNAEVWTTQPDALLLLPVTEDIKTWPRMFASKAEVDQWVEHQAGVYLAIWDAAARKLAKGRIYQTLFVQPLERPLGDLERQYPFSRSQSLRALNDYLIERRPPHVSLIDMDGLASYAGRREWFDETGYFLSKQHVSLRELPLVCAYLARRISSGYGFVRKCIVLDLDNTLWGGVVGDDGVDGIRVSASDPVGEAFVYFQKYLLALKERGVLLAVCSKNDDTVARNAFSARPDMPLQLSDFSAFVANWDDKVSNIRRIASELNIGVDSVVFFDDNPAERAIVQEYEPRVLTIDVPKDPSLYVRALDSSFAFEWEQFTKEDTARAETYAKDRERRELETQFTDYEDYLRSLQMKAWIQPITSDGIARANQLFGKTNQFNTRGERYSEGMLAGLASATDSSALQVKFADCFSHYGIVASIVLKQYGRAVFIDNWIMSCRVFERGLEKATLEAVITYARKHNFQRIVGEFIPTSKNTYVERLFENLGFRQDPDNSDGIVRVGSGILYVLPLDHLPQIEHHIEVVGPFARFSEITGETREIEQKGLS